MSNCLSAIVSSLLYFRCMLKSLPSRGCLSCTWRRVLPCSWPSDLLIAWHCAMRSLVWHWSCYQRSWWWRKKRKRVKQSLELLVKRRKIRRGCCCGLELPTCSRVTVTHTWKTGNRLWLTTRGVWEGINLFLWLISDLKFRVVLCHLGVSTSWSGCSLNREVSTLPTCFLENLPIWHNVALLLTVCLILLIYLMYRLPPTDPRCRCGCQVWNISVCPTKAEGAFISWEGHQFLTDRATERGAERLAAEPTCITRYNRALSLH